MYHQANKQIACAQLASWIRLIFIAAILHGAAAALIAAAKILCKYVKSDVDYSRSSFGIIFMIKARKNLALVKRGVGFFLFLRFIAFTNDSSLHRYWC